MKKLVTFLAFLLAVVPMVGISGCGIGPEMLIGPIVTGVIYWKNGEATKYYANDYASVSRATNRALMEMGLPITKKEEGKNSVYIIAGNNNRFKIHVEYVEPNITRLRCRIDFMGDKPYAELMYRKVDDEVGILEFDEQGNPTRNKR